MNTAGPSGHTVKASGLVHRRNIVHIAFCCATIAAGREAVAQASPLRRVAILEVTPHSTSLAATFRTAMQELGWQEGRNVKYHWASAEGHEDRLPALARTLLAGGAEVIVNSSAVSTRALQQATRTVPIVMVNAVDPVGNGFAESLARPGGNITGVSNQAQDILGKLTELLRQLVPQARRMAFVLNENNPSFGSYRAALPGIATALGFSASLVTVRVLGDIPTAVQKLRSLDVQGVVMPPDTLFLSAPAAWSEQLAPLRLPVVWGQRRLIEHGGLLSYGSNSADNWRTAARFVDRLLKGAHAAELPIEQPTRFNLVINLRAARQLGLTVPQSLLVRADEVIE